MKDKAKKSNLTPVVYNKKTTMNYDIAILVMGLGIIAMLVFMIFNH